MVKQHAHEYAAVGPVRAWLQAVDADWLIKQRQSLFCSGPQSLGDVESPAVGQTCRTSGHSQVINWMSGMCHRCLLHQALEESSATPESDPSACRRGFSGSLFSQVAYIWVEVLYENMWSVEPGRAARAIAAREPRKQVFQALLWALIKLKFSQVLNF